MSAWIIGIMLISFFVGLAAVAQRIMDERRRNERITAALYRLGDAYKDATERLQALKQQWAEDDNR